MKNKQTNSYLLDADLPIKPEILANQNHYLKEKKYKKKKKRKLKLWVLLLIFLVLIITLSLSLLKIIYWSIDNKATTQNIYNIDKITDIKEIEDNKNTKLINEPQEQENDYWYYIKFPLIQVNFTELKEKNPDTVAWIQINNTNINYPIVQTTNNDYYLNHSYDKTTNEAGWVFMDFRNNPTFSSKNTIIYAHSRLDKTMFGSLSKVLKANWYQNKDNHIIKISTPTENSLWQIFSVYKIKEETYYITTDFSSNDTYLEFLNTLKKRSKYDFNTTLTETDHLLTLSTCYSDTERTVVHAKKIKSSTRTS